MVGRRARAVLVELGGLRRRADGRGTRSGAHRRSDAGHPLVPRPHGQLRAASAGGARRPGAHRDRRGRRANGDHVRRAPCAGGGLRGAPEIHRGGRGRPSRRHPAERRGGGSRAARHRVDRRGLVGLRAGVRARRDRLPIPPARPQGGDCGSRLPPRRQGPRPPRRAGGGLRVAPFGAGGRVGHRAYRRRADPARRSVGRLDDGDGVPGRARYRGRGVQPSAVGAVLLWHHRHPQGHRARARWGAAGAAENLQHP